jgi:F-type H+-transporting ATPase subunit b
MDIFPNWTVLPIVFFLIVLLIFLSRSFFGPMAAALSERDQRIGGAQREAEEIRRSLQLQEDEFNRRIRDARREADRQMAEVKKAAFERKSGIVSAKKTEAEATLTAARAEIRKKTEEALAELERQSGQFARLIANRILKRAASSQQTRV